MGSLFLRHALHRFHGVQAAVTAFDIMLTSIASLFAQARVLVERVQTSFRPDVRLGRRGRPLFTVF